MNIPASTNFILDRTVYLDKFLVLNNASEVFQTLFDVNATAWLEEIERVFWAICGCFFSRDWSEQIIP